MATERTTQAISDSDARALLAKLEQGGQELLTADEDILETIFAQAERDDVNGYASDPLLHRALLYQYARFGGLA